VRSGNHFQALFLFGGKFWGQIVAAEEKPEGKGFTVQDRRRFSPETGEAREAEESAKESSVSSATESGSQPRAKAEPRSESLPEINFSTFVISLSTQALMHLGEIANPLSGNVESDIPLAKQMIDILGMLQEKTRGNLDAGEERLIEDILFDLRMKYVEAVKKK
jgi:hypothetical protein